MYMKNEWHSRQNITEQCNLSPKLVQKMLFQKLQYAEFQMQQQKKMKIHVPHKNKQGLLDQVPIHSLADIQYCTCVGKRKKATGPEQDQQHLKNFSVSSSKTTPSHRKSKTKRRATYTIMYCECLYMPEQHEIPVCHLLINTLIVWWYNDHFFLENTEHCVIFIKTREAQVQPTSRNKAETRK